MKWLYAGLVLAAGLFVLALSFGASLQLEGYRKLRTEGPRVDGTVTEQLGSKGSNARYYSYTYTVGNAVHTRTRQSIPWDARSIPVGTKIPVWYDPAQPTRAVTGAELEDMESWGNRFIFPAIGLVLVAAALVLIGRKGQKKNPA